jgi:GAF domain-containing protein
MAENLVITATNKEEKYQELIPQIKALITGESNRIANMANISAAIQSVFNHLWTGFYIVEEEQLVLGPFQGPIACTRIAFGRGVCGTAWKEEKTIIVPNVNEFPGHIACSSQSVSEIVVPIFHNGNVTAILDIDSIHEDHFDSIDQQYLTQICQLLS